MLGVFINENDLLSKGLRDCLTHSPVFHSTELFFIALFFITFSNAIYKALMHAVKT